LASLDRASSNVGAGNWKGLGMWAWILFRIAGLVLVFYLFAHIGVISTGRVGGESTINDLFGLFDFWLFVLLDLLLVWAVLFHAMNGVRIVLMDMGIGIHRHKLVFWLCMAAALAILAVFAAVAFRFLLDEWGAL
jgi:succinate dehydrogenase / fumarate reductase cytochrome b subunit